MGDREGDRCFRMAPLLPPNRLDRELLGLLWSREGETSSLFMLALVAVRCCENEPMVIVDGVEVMRFRVPLPTNVIGGEDDSPIRSVTLNSGRSGSSSIDNRWLAYFRRQKSDAVSC